MLRDLSRELTAKRKQFVMLLWVQNVHMLWDSDLKIQAQRDHFRSCCEPCWNQTIRSLNSINKKIMWLWLLQFLFKISSSKKIQVLNLFSPSLVVKNDPWGSTPTAAKASPTLPAMLAPSPARAMAAMAMAPEPKVWVIFGRKNWAFLKGWIIKGW